MSRAPKQVTLSHPIPDSALDRPAAFVGATGSGKTVAAKGGVERLLDRGQRVTVVDPTGVWWGMRTSADGKSPGYNVVIFGGDHADVPIAPTMANGSANWSPPGTCGASSIRPNSRGRR